MVFNMVYLVTFSPETRTAVFNRKNSHMCHAIYIGRNCKSVIHEHVCAAVFLPPQSTLTLEYVSVEDCFSCSNCETTQIEVDQLAVLMITRILMDRIEKTGTDWSNEELWKNECS